MFSGVLCKQGAADSTNNILSTAVLCERVEKQMIGTLYTVQCTIVQCTWTYTLYIVKCAIGCIATGGGRRQPRLKGGVQCIGLRLILTIKVEQKKVEKNMAILGSKWQKRSQSGVSETMTFRQQWFLFNRGLPWFEAKSTEGAETAFEGLTMLETMNILMQLTHKLWETCKCNR